MAHDTKNYEGPKVNTSMETIRKTFDSDMSVDQGSRTVIATISTSAIDRDNEVVLPKGLVKQQFNGNPVVLYCHDTSTLPIGKCLWIKSTNDSVIAKYQLGKTDVCNDILSLMQDGILRAHSVGFQSLESSPPSQEEIKANPSWADVRMVHRKWNLLEFSLCPIPCNPEALAIAVSKSYHPETLAFLGEQFAPRPDCWEWREEPEPVEVKAVEVTPEVKVEEKPTPVPTGPTGPTLAEIRKELLAIIESAPTVEDYLRKLHGKA